MLTQLALLFATGCVLVIAGVAIVIGAARLCAKRMKTKGLGERPLNWLGGTWLAMTVAGAIQYSLTPMPFGAFVWIYSVLTVIGMVALLIDEYSWRRKRRNAPTY
jgi:hypothetical protein